jgi:hypothetical protein
MQDVLELLDARAVPGEPWQLEKLRKWIEGLVEARGSDYVRQNRRELLTQWNEHARGRFKSCV